MNDQIKTTFKENNISIELLEDMEQNYPSDFIEFIYDIMTFKDAISFYEKYKEYDTFDSLYELVCYVDDYHELCCNHTFANKMYILVNELIHNKIDLKDDDNHNLNTVLNILLMYYGNAIEQ